jgi:hypothetical protein
MAGGNGNVNASKRNTIFPPELSSLLRNVRKKKKWS